MAKGATVKAVKSYEAPLPRYLNLQVGDLLLLTDTEMERYYGGKNVRTGDVGWFPIDTVRIASKEEAALAAVAGATANGPASRPAVDAAPTERTPKERVEEARPPQSSGPQYFAMDNDDDVEEEVLEASEPTAGEALHQATSWQAMLEPPAAVPAAAAHQVAFEDSWEAYQDFDKRTWLWSPTSKEFFFVDTPGEWLEASDCGRKYWWNKVNHTWFWDPPSRAATA